MRIAVYTAIGALVLIVISCDSAYYDRSTSFDNSFWLYDDARSFSFDITDTTKIFDMILEVDHTDEFPYQNLYLKTSTSFPSDTVISQLLSLDMANEAGFWFGDCSASNCQISIPIQSGVHFQEVGTYQLELLQHSRSDTLVGLKSIGLKLLELK